MRIVELSAENVKRLRAVDITPAEHVQVVAGRNAQGKTSVLDAIWLALGGGAASKATVRPVRDGQDHARVRLDLGDIVVTRTWAGDKTTLKVESADGAKYGSPQSMLDSLVGRLSFDPLEFTHLSAREQVSSLLDLVDLGIDLSALAEQRQTAYDTRTDVGRTVRTLEGHQAALGFLDDSAPAVEVSVSDLLAEFRDVDAGQRAYVANMAAQVDTTEEVRVLQERLTVAQARLVELEDALLFQHDAAAELEVLQARIDNVEGTNAAVRRNNDVRGCVDALKTARGEYDAQTDLLATIDKTKADALASATFPVDGLGFDDDGVTYGGVPFSQASAAEQIRVSLAMAMALNPKLRVIRILDGSLLDADNLALIAEMATSQDYQVWIERVGDGDGIGVVIDDGSVAP